MSFIDLILFILFQNFNKPLKCLEKYFSKNERMYFVYQNLCNMSPLIFIDNNLCGLNKMH